MSMNPLLTVLLLGGMAFGQAQISDVPAVHIPVKSEFGSVSCDNLMACLGCSNNGHTATLKAISPDVTQEPKCVGGWRWGCADKSAILLTAEDETRHCLKLGTPVPVSDSVIGHETPTGALLMQQPNVFEFIDHNKMIVSMSNKGEITFGEGYTPEAAGKAFWEEFSKQYRLSRVPAEEPAKTKH